MVEYSGGRLNLYLPTDTGDSFGSIFLPELAENMRKINRALDSIPYDIAQTTADNTGVNDSQAALQNALDSYGAVVLEKGKTYRLSQPLTGKDIKIFANGAKIITDFAAPALNFAGTLVGANRTITADYTVGNNFLTLGDVTGIEVGHLIHVQSTESYNSERAYYRRGGNALVTRIEGNNVYLSHAFPASMTAGNINICEIYDPAKVYIEKLTLESTVPLSADGPQYGLLISMGANVVLNDVYVDNYVSCIHLDTCVNPFLFKARTGRAWYSGTGTSYGILNNSCSGLTMFQCTTASGRHGYTSGGEEPVIQTLAIACQFHNEQGSVAFDTHGNNFDTHLVHCHIDSFGVNGFVRFDYCTIDNTGTDDNQIYPGEAYQRAGYEWNNCRFLGTAHNIKVVGYYQVLTTTRIYIDKISIQNCQVAGDLQLFMNLEDTVSGTKAEIRTVDVKNTHPFRTNWKDNIGYLKVENCGYYLDNAMILQSSGYCDEFHIIDCIVPNRYLAIQVTNFRFGELKGPQLTSVGSTSGRLNFGSAAATLKFDCCDLSALHQGVQMSTVAKGVFIGSKIKWYAANFASFFTAASGDYIKGADGLLYTLGIDSTGAIIKTVVPQAG